AGSTTITALPSRISVTVPATRPSSPSRPTYPSCRTNTDADPPGAIFTSATPPTLSGAGRGGLRGTGRRGTGKGGAKGNGKARNGKGRATGAGRGGQSYRRWQRRRRPSTAC